MAFMAANFTLHWAGSSRFSLFQWERRWRLLPASELFVRRTLLRQSKSKLFNVKTMIRPSLIAAIITSLIVSGCTPGQGRCLAWGEWCRGARRIARMAMAV